MNSMILPGFTAEASLYNTRGRYRMVPSLGQGGVASGQQLVPQNCLPVGENCTVNGDCCNNWCNESNQCDCFDIGDECFLGPESCCSGTCIDGICGPSAAISVSWIPFGDGMNGLAIVMGSNFAPNSQFSGNLTNCEFGGGWAPLIANTDGAGSFVTWIKCLCSGSTSAFGCDQSGNCAQGGASIPC